MFVSESQRRLCWLLASKAKKTGKKSTWNCKEWQAKTKKKLPMYKKRKARGGLKIHPTVKKVAIGAAGLAGLLASALFSHYMKQREILPQSPYADIFLTQENMGGALNRGPKRPPVRIIPPPRMYPKPVKIYTS